MKIILKEVFKCKPPPNKKRAPAPPGLFSLGGKDLASLPEEGQASQSQEAQEGRLRDLHFVLDVFE